MDATGDRLARECLSFIKRAVELHGSRVIELEESDSDEEFDSALLVGFITRFTANYHGKRSNRRKKGSGLPKG
jgi:predicted site-specific integrase-resolvase